MPPKNEAQGHDEGPGHIEKQGQVSSVFTDDETKENVQPPHSNSTNYNNERRIPNKDEHCPQSGSHPSQGSAQSTANQQSGESAKPAETYISLIAKVILPSVCISINEVTLVYVYWKVH